VEDEISHFSEYFAGRSVAGASPVQEAVLDLHDEALRQLTDLARSLGVRGSNEFERSVALQHCLDEFSEHASSAGDSVTGELHFFAGDYKPRTLCMFTDTLKRLGALERDLHCSETILIESAIRYASERQPVA